MHARWAICIRRWVAPLVAGVVCMAGGAAPAQQIQIELLGSPRQFELTPPQVQTVSGATEARLEQVKALVADARWPEVVRALDELADDRTGRVVEVGDGLYVSLPTDCQMQLAGLPPAGLAAYRSQADAAAERWYRKGLAARDPALLGRVVNDAFCSSPGDDALWALGELALERGDYGAARRAWEQMSPLTRDPTGKPLWLALRDVDLDAHWPEVRRRWEQRDTAPDWLAYPDTSFDLADIRARLVLVSIREGDLDRAAVELDAFRRFHPQAVGRLAGEEGPYAAALARLLVAAQDWSQPAPGGDWTTYAARPTREAVAPAVGQIAGPAWREPIRLDRSDWQRRQRLGDQTQPQPDAVVRESDRPLSYYPLVVGQRVFYTDGREIHAAELATGEPAITRDGVLYRVASYAKADDRALVERAGEAAAGVPRYTMTEAGGVLYARVGSPITGRLQPGPTPAYERLVGLDLRRDGLLVFQVRPDDENWSFDGAPVGDGRRVFVTMRRSDVAPREYVACFDAATGKRLWRTPVAAADTPAAGRGDEITHNLLTLAGDRLYLNTNLGVVAALAPGDGRICWLRRYDRAAGTQTAPGALHFDRDPSPGVYWRGMLMVAPSDTPTVFALDADTGTPLWTSARLADVTGLVGVAEGNLIAGGNRVWGVDARSGDVRFAWPESEHAGVRGMGRGLVAGGEVFWPARHEIHVLDAKTGRQARRPIQLAPLSKAGVNLVAAHGALLAAGYDRLGLLGPPVVAPDDKTSQEGLAALGRRGGPALNRKRVVAVDGIAASVASDQQLTTNHQPLTTNH